MFGVCSNGETKKNSKPLNNQILKMECPALLFLQVEVESKPKTFAIPFVTISRSNGGIWQPSPILLACHRARWLSVGLLHDEGGLRFRSLSLFIIICTAQSVLPRIFFL